MSQQLDETENNVPRQAGEGEDRPAMDWHRHSFQMPQIQHGGVNLWNGRASRTGSDAHVRQLDGGK